MESSENGAGVCQTNVVAPVKSQDQANVRKNSMVLREIAREKERKRMPGMANFILLCLERQEYLFIAVKVKRSRRMRTEQEAVYKQTKNKPGNQTFRICKYFY